MPKVICLALPIMMVVMMFHDGSGTGENEQEVGTRVLVGAFQAEDRGKSLPERSQRKTARALLGLLEVNLVSNLDSDERALLERYLEVLTGDERGRQRWCWSEGTREEKVAAFVAAERLVGGTPGLVAPLANQFLGDGRWSETATDGFETGGQGDPVVVTWSLVPDGTLVSGTSGLANGGSDLREWLAGIYGGAASGVVEGQPWFGVFEEAFEAMAATCGVELRFEPNDDGAAMGGTAPGESGVRGDIRIGARFLDGSGGLLGISRGPNDGDMVLDSGDVILSQTGGDSLRLLNTLTHEIGHCLGLAHVCPVNQTKLMEPNLSTSFRGPQFDEFQSLQRLYGDPLERQGDLRDNDSAGTASGLVVPADGVISRPRLSIDDDRDVDFFKIAGLNGQRLGVVVVPGEGTYAEGAEGGEGCSGGADFDSGAVNDLRVGILDEDGETVLAEADGFGPGGAEKIDLYELPRTGNYYVKVWGGAVNAAQLYELKIELQERLPGPRLVMGEPMIVAESGVVKNGKTDPGETVRVRFSLVNEGISPTGALSLSVVGSANVTVFEENGPDALSAGEAGFVEVVFGAVGECGDEALVDLRVEDGSGVLVEKRARFGLGEILSPVPFEADFDEGSSLPGGWESEESGSGNEWEAVSSRFDTPLRAAFAGGGGETGEAALLSPSFELSSGGGTLSFRHLYRTEVGFDGGVLEVSRDGGAWMDVISGYDLVVTGGYDRLIREGFASAIAGRMAWSGRLSQFVSTSVEIPPGWAGEMLQFRWRFVQDQSGTSEGWWVDTVRMEMVVADCEVHRPALNLRLQSGGLDENFPNREAVLILESELPLAGGLVVPLLAGGTAVGEDYTGGLVVSFPPGVTTVEIPLEVRRDELDEEEEELTVAVPPSEPGFAAGGDSFVRLVITDRVDLQGWLQSGFEVPVEVGGDQDGDGLTGLGEYLLGTDPMQSASRVELTPVVREGVCLVPTGILPVRDDAVLGVEVSDDLIAWEDRAFERSDEGLLVPSSGGWRFLRLTFRVVE